MLFAPQTMSQQVICHCVQCSITNDWHILRKGTSIAINLSSANFSRVFLQTAVFYVTSSISAHLAHLIFQTKAQKSNTHNSHVFSFFSRVGPNPYQQQRKPVNENRVGGRKRETERGWAGERRKIWAPPCHAVSCDFQSRTVGKGAGKERGGGVRRVWWSQQIGALARLGWFELPRPECSLQMSCGEIVFRLQVACPVAALSI